MSEEFGGRLPSEILAELERLPVGFMEQIIEYRAYAATRGAYERQQNPKAESEMWQLVKLIDFELAQEEIDARG